MDGEENALRVAQILERWEKYLQEQIQQISKRLHLTSTAQLADWLAAVAGNNMIGSFAREAQPVITLTNATVNINTIAPERICNEVLLRSHIDNTSRIWVNFDKPAVANFCYPLDPGEVLTVDLSNVKRINALFTVADEILFVIPEV